MSDKAGRAADGAPKDPLGIGAVLSEIVKKLSSQALLFGLAVIVVIVASWYLFDSRAVLVIAAVLVVFVIALLGYLFVEQKRTVEPEAAAWFDPSDRKAPPTGDGAGRPFAIELWTEPATGSGIERGSAPAGDIGARNVGARDIGIVATRERAYRIGDPIVIKFRSTRDCYLTLLNLGTSGRLTILFPNARHPDNFIRAGELHHIPDPSFGFEFRLQGPPGTERLKAIATLEKITLLESQFTPEGGLFETRPVGAAPRDIAVIDRSVARLPPSDWMEATARFAVASA